MGIYIVWLGHIGSLVKTNVKFVDVSALVVSTGITVWLYRIDK